MNEKDIERYVKSLDLDKTAEANMIMELNIGRIEYEALQKIGVVDDVKTFSDVWDLLRTRLDESARQAIIDELVKWSQHGTDQMVNRRMHMMVNALRGSD